MKIIAYRSLVNIGGPDFDWVNDRVEPLIGEIPTPDELETKGLFDLDEVEVWEDGECSTYEWSKPEKIWKLTGKRK